MYDQIMKIHIFEMSWLKNKRFARTVINAIFFKMLIYLGLQEKKCRKSRDSLSTIVPVQIILIKIRSKANKKVFS